MAAPAAGVRRSARELGDLFVWGSLVSYEDDEWMERNPRVRTVARRRSSSDRFGRLHLGATS